MNIFVGGAVLAASATAIPTLTDRALIEMEEKIFEHKEAAEAINFELDRLGAILRGEQLRLYEAAVVAGNVVETEDQRLEQVGAMPEHIEHGRLIDLQDTHWYAADELVSRMWALPAQTRASRSAGLYHGRVLAPPGRPP